MDKEACIYSITNTINKKKYIGVTVDFKRRIREHKYTPRKKIQIDLESGHTWKDFIFKKELVASEEYCYEMEQSFIEYFEAEYNSSEGGKYAPRAIGSDHWNAKFSEEQVIEIRTLYNDGKYNQKQLGELYGCSNKVISKITGGERWAHIGGPIAKNNLKFRAKNKAKLTEQDVVDIREIFSQGGIKIKDIAEIYNVDRHAISNLLNGRTWRDVSGPIRGIDYAV